MIGAPEVVSAAIKAATTTSVVVIIANGHDHTMPISDTSFHSAPTNMQLTAATVSEVMSALKTDMHSSIDVICLREDGTVLGFHGRQLATVEVVAPSGKQLATITMVDNATIREVCQALAHGASGVDLDIQLIHDSNALASHIRLRDLAVSDGALNFTAVCSNRRLTTLDKACGVTTQHAEYLLDAQDSHLSLNPPVGRRMARTFGLNREDFTNREFIETLRSILQARAQGQLAEDLLSEVHSTSQLRPIGTVSLMGSSSQQPFAHRFAGKIVESFLAVVPSKLAYTLVYQDCRCENIKMISSAPVRCNEMQAEIQQAKRSRSRSKRRSLGGSPRRSRSNE